MLPWIKENKNWLKAALIAMFLIMVAFLFFPLLPAQAQTNDTFGLQPVGQSIGLTSADIRVVIGRIVRAVLGLLGIIATAIILYAGYLIMTSAGEEEKITKGKRTLINAVIGSAIILSALTIVQFVLNGLTGDSRRRAEGQNAPAWDSFSGSGSLGRVVKEHYPFRDQMGVPRNTKISVTFSEAIAPASLIENTNQTCWPKNGDNKPIAMGTDGADCLKDEDNKPVEYFGDCVLGDNFSWENSCDHLRIEAVSIYNSTSTKYAGLNPDKDFVKAAVMAVYEKDQASVGEYNAFTFVFKPFNPQYLGSGEENAQYTVRLTYKINKKEKVNDEFVSIFDRQYKDYYFWEFETGTDLDLTPPYVKSARPRENSVVKKNNIVQVYFSEPMDPTVAAGYLSYDSLTHLFFDSMVTGTWKLSNGYQVAEFVSDLECGVNSCGEKMYCLPVACADPADKECKQIYEAMARAGQLLNTDGLSFEAVPFSGLMDMAGNALDGNKNEAAEPRPNSALSFAEQKQPDNYFWFFTVQNKIDREAPFVEWITPGIDKEEVKGKDSLKMRFSKVMWLATLYSPEVFLEEYPLAMDVTTTVKDVLGFYPVSDLKIIAGADDRTELQLKTTREFGPYNLDLYYFPQVKSSVKTETQNCLYPGRGPWGAKNTAPVCVYKEDDQGNPIQDTGANCVPVTMSSSADTGCAAVFPSADTVLQPDVSKCLEKLIEFSTR